MFSHISITAVHVLDQDEALDFYVGKLGLEVRSDVDFGATDDGGMRWLTVGVPGDKQREIMLEKPGRPNHDANSAEEARELVTKGGAAGWVIFETDDVHRTHAELKSKGVELPEEPTGRPYGIDFGLRDPFGNNLRVTQRR
ncbi:VOC family protein [Propionibacteriaceae bacterium Y1685]